VKPTGKVVELPPQTSSFSFNEQGEVRDRVLGGRLAAAWLQLCCSADQLMHEQAWCCCSGTRQHNTASNAPNTVYSTSCTAATCNHADRQAYYSLRCLNALRHLVHSVILPPPMLATCLVLLLLLLLLSLLPTCQVIDFTMGYVTDRRLGNTGSLGGAFGLLYAIGCPFTYP
jgi:hypothetical protein